MPDAPKLSLAELRGIVTDPGELAKGAKLVDAGDLSHLSRHEHKLFADAQGSTIYKVQAIAEDKGWRGRCSCMAARSRPFCKHSAALLVAWQRTPDAFAVADAPPPGSGEAKKKQVKAGKVDAKDLMGKGVEQVMTLVRELAVAGAASIADDRADQVRALGENLREHRLRRLSAKTIALAEMLQSARSKGDDFNALAYAELLGDLLLTARKLEKHIGGEALEDKHVEELVGKTWTKKDRAPVQGLDLIEVAFVTRETADGFTIRESRFVDAASGGHYSEKQILPAFLVKRTPAKPSHAGKVLRGASGGLYPGYAPRRTDLESPGAVEALASDMLDRVVAHATPSVKAAIAALAEYKKDVFAPDELPIAIACDMVIANHGRLQLADRDGSAVFLPDDHDAADRLASALAGVSLEAVIGDLGLDGALPTLTPLAIVVTGRDGKELRPVGSSLLRPATKKVKLAAGPAERRSNWAYTARALELSTAAIALGEVREELADLVFTGLTSLTTRRSEPIATRLGELGLTKQAELLRAAAGKPDASERLDDTVKLHQVLGIALARLAGAAQIDREQFVASPMFASVYVRKESALLAPVDIARKLARGEVNRFEAAALTGRYYETLDPSTLIEQAFPTWADGAASPYVALAARARPERAVEVARHLLMTRSSPRMAAVTSLRVLEALGQGELLSKVAGSHHSVTVREMAKAARARLDGRPLEASHEILAVRAALFNASTKDTRARAAEDLADAGDVGAIPLLRMSFAGDISGDVRDASGRALGRLGDADSVETFCIALGQRDQDHERAKTAAYALGFLGDVRGLDALVTAYRAAWLPNVLAEALGAVGLAAVPALLEIIEAHPEILKRSTASEVFEAIPTDALRVALLDRIDALSTLPDFIDKASALVELARTRVPLDAVVGARILELRPDLLDKKATREARALARKSGGKPN